MYIMKKMAANKNWKLKTYAWDQIYSTETKIFAFFQISCTTLVLSYNGFSFGVFLKVEYNCDDIL